MITTFAVLMLLCSVVPALLFLRNLRAFAPPPQASPTNAFSVSVLIPARNEEANIAAVLQSVAASTQVDLEVIAYDDASTDRTAAIVLEEAARDPRIRLLSASTPLPAGWNGKQHACWQLAQASTQPYLLFLDADVRVEPEAVARMGAFQQQGGSARLVSGFPRLVTVGLLEKILLALIHFVLLGFLPVDRMRRTTDAAMAAGCGQFLLVEREAYFAMGGHAAIKATMHDGLLMPRAFRRAGFATDLADITTLAHVRMYDTATKVWQGLAKNATEGIAAPARIVPLTLLLLLGQVFPAIIFIVLCLMMTSIYMIGAEYDHPHRFAAFAVATVVAATCSYLPRLLAVRRFRQPLLSALLHPLGITLLLCVQWYALTRQLLGRPVGWRARDYAADTGAEISKP